MRWPQFRGIEEARHLARDFCQDALSENFLRTLHRRRDTGIRVRVRVRETNAYLYKVLQSEMFGDSVGTLLCNMLLHCCFTSSNVVSPTATSVSMVRI